MSGRRVVARCVQPLPPVCRAAGLWSKPRVTVFAFAYSGEEEAFRTELRAWLAAHLPAEPVPDGEEERHRFLRAWQRSLAASHWVGIHWPHEYGGRGATLKEQII